MGIVMASKSPRRRELMALVTQAFTVDVAGVDEGAVVADEPEMLVEQLARKKAAGVYMRRKGDVVIGCDTVVALDGAVLGKPRDAQDAQEMLTALAGRRHEVHTGVAIYAPATRGLADAFVETTAVWFAEVAPAEIAAYVKTDEPYDKAGGYGIQGWAGRYITRVEGCFYNVMGLPVAALYHRLAALGLLDG